MSGRLYSQEDLKRAYEDFKKYCETDTRSFWTIVENMYKDEDTDEAQYGFETTVAEIHAPKYPFNKENKLDSFPFCEKSYLYHLIQSILWNTPALLSKRAYQYGVGGSTRIDLTDENLKTFFSGKACFRTLDPIFKSRHFRFIYKIITNTFTRVDCDILLARASGGASAAASGGASAAASGGASAAASGGASAAASGGASAAATPAIPLELINVKTNGLVKTFLEMSSLILGHSNDIEGPILDYLESYHINLDIFREIRSRYEEEQTREAREKELREAREKELVTKPMLGGIRSRIRSRSRSRSRSRRQKQKKRRYSKRKTQTH